MIGGILMKKFLFIALILVFCSLAIAEEAPGSGYFYEYEDFEAEITGTYFYTENGQDYIVIAAHWKNLYSGPLIDIL